MKVIGYHIEDNIIADSNNRIETESRKYPWFLLHNSKRLNICWNLNYFVAKYLKAIGVPKEAAQKLWATQKLQDMENNIEYTFYPGRNFSIKFGKSFIGSEFVSLADAQQYTKEELEDAENKTRLASYVIKKAKQAQAAGQEAYNTFISLDCSPKSLTSPINAYQRSHLVNMGLPTVSDLKDDEVALWAYECVHGGWVECFHRGHFKSSYDYDINSAYGKELMAMPDFRRGIWVKSNKIPSNAKLGFLQGEINIESDLSPIIYSLSEQSSYTPTGYWNGIFTLDEILFIIAYNMGSFNLNQGWFWIPTDDIEYPLMKTMIELYQRKETVVVSDIEKSCIKRIMTGIWGKTVERYDGGRSTGPLFNPVWGSLVESRARLQVTKLCIEAINQKARILSIAVDGVVTDKEIKIQKNSPKLMGHWRLSTAGPCIIVSSGVLGVSDKRANAADFTIDYNKLKEMLESDPGSRYYTQRKNGFVSLGTALIHNRYDELGKREVIERTIDVMAEPKRYTEDGPMTGRDILNNQYETEPWDVHFIMGDRID